MNDQNQVSLDWQEAERHLQAVEEAYGSIGMAGSFALTLVINPCRVRFNQGERTQELYDEIMEIAL